DETGYKLGSIGTRPHQRHIPFQDIEKLRRFIDPIPAQPSAERCEPRIVHGCEYRTGAPLCAFSHGSKFQNSKKLSRLAHPVLNVEAPPPIGYFDGERHYNPHRNQDNRCPCAQHKVSTAFEKRGDGIVWVANDFDQWNIVKTEVLDPPDQDFIDRW